MQPKIFNINVKRPQVLLLGNGITHYFGNNISWEKAIKSISVNSYEDLIDVPNTIKASAFFDIDDKNRQDNYFKTFSNDYYGTEDNYDIDVIEKLLNINCDAILTTNFTYELENILCPNYFNLNDNTKRKHSYYTSSQYESKYLLRTYNSFIYNQQQKDIWHIHGETRRKSSLIFNHDEYARLIEKIIAYNKSRGNEYALYSDCLKFKSWIDYFILGDVYCLGFGFDFAEFDLWWLLSRRMRESTGKGKFIFYEPSKKDKSKSKILSKFYVEHKNFEIFPNGTNKSQDYRKFMLEAINDINKQINQNI